MRPDMVVHLPGGGAGRHRREGARSTPSCSSSRPTTRRPASACLDKHARQLRTHVDQLAKKEYWKQFDRSPEFVVAFIPGDQLLAAACEADPALQDYAMSKRIVLRHAEHARRPAAHDRPSWQQETLAENARQVQQLGAELYERLRTMTGHMQSLQRSLTSSVDAYNKAVGSLESRVLVSARKFPASASSAANRPRSPSCRRSRPHRATSRRSRLDDEDEREPTILALPDGGASTRPPRA